LDAIKMGLWDFEPTSVDQTNYSPTGAMPGSQEKIEVLADRARNGLPLWHDLDRTDYDDDPDRHACA
jgi:hypothetical protein